MCLCLDTPRSRRLNTDSKSNILFYLTGHGGENFLKFQDDEEINAFELADAFEQMNQKKRYNSTSIHHYLKDALGIIKDCFCHFYTWWNSRFFGDFLIMPF